MKKIDKKYIKWQQPLKKDLKNKDMKIVIQKQIVNIERNMMTKFFVYIVIIVLLSFLFGIELGIILLNLHLL